MNARLWIYVNQFKIKNCKEMLWYWVQSCFNNVRSSTLTNLTELCKKARPHLSPYYSQYIPFKPCFYVTLSINIMNQQQQQQHESNERDTVTVWAWQQRAKHSMSVTSDEWWTWRVCEQQQQQWWWMIHNDMIHNDMIHMICHVILLLLLLYVCSTIYYTVAITLIQAHTGSH